MVGEWAPDDAWQYSTEESGSSTCPDRYGPDTVGYGRLTVLIRLGLPQFLPPLRLELRFNHTRLR